jgi:hypothetical protein
VSGLYFILASTDERVSDRDAIGSDLCSIPTCCDKCAPYFIATGPVTIPGKAGRAGGFRLRAPQSGSVAAANAALSRSITTCARTLPMAPGSANPPLRPQDAGEGRGGGQVPCGCSPHPRLWLPRNLKVSVRRNKPHCGLLSPQAGEGAPHPRKCRTSAASPAEPAEPAGLPVGVTMPRQSRRVSLSD